MRRLPKAKDSFKLLKKTPGEIDAMTLRFLSQQADRQAGRLAGGQAVKGCMQYPAYSGSTVHNTYWSSRWGATVQSMRLSCSIRLLGISPRSEVTRTTPSLAELNSITWLLRYVSDGTLNMKCVSCKTRVSGQKLNKNCKNVQILPPARPPEKLNTKHGPYLFRFENEKWSMSGLG